MNGQSILQKYVLSNGATSISFSIIQGFTSLILLISFLSAERGEFTQILIALAILSLFGGLVIRIITRHKTQSVSFMTFSLYGPSWGIVDIPIPKTEEEKARDQRFISRFIPLSPIMLITFVILGVAIMGGEDQHSRTDGEEFQVFGQFLIAWIGSWMAIYFGSAALQKWRPSIVPLQIVKGVTTGFIFMPFTFFLVAGALGVIDALLLLFLS